MKVSLEYNAASPGGTRRTKRPTLLTCVKKEERRSPVLKEPDPGGSSGATLSTSAGAHVSPLSQLLVNLFSSLSALPPLLISLGEGVVGCRAA